MLRTMRNMPLSDNTLLARGLKALSARFPQRWSIVPARSTPRLANYRPDAVLEVRAPDGRRAILLVEVKSRLTAQQAAALGPRLSEAASRSRVAGALLVAPFVGVLARDRLRKAGVSYFDLAGNARLALERPALLIETQGADKEPSPPKRGIKSLKGAKAARLVRALCDWRSPIGVRELARRAGTDPGYTTRVLDLLEESDVIRRSDGKVADVNWQDLLRRWTQDYDVGKTNRAVPYLAPRGLEGFTSRLGNYRGKWALTGSLAVPRAASISPARLASCYVDDPERTADKLQLRRTDVGANVLLLEPFDSVVWERTRQEAGLACVAVSQCAADLLTGPGREPAEADALFAWMARNEDAWRA
jgi:hypothetical protein